MKSDAPLTEGSILRGLLGLSGPMFVSGILQNLQSVIDMYWVGGLGHDAMAAVGAAGTVLMLMFPVIIGTSLGTVALVARAIGAGQRDEASRVAGNSLVLALVVGIGLGIVGWVFAEDLCRVLGADASVVRSGTTYLKISFLGSFTVFILFTANSALQGAGNAMLPMVAMLIANVINIILDPLLIFGWLGFPRMEVAGAAVATIVSQALAAAVVVFRLARGDHGLSIRARDWKLDRDISMRLLRVGIPSTGQMMSRSLMAVALMGIVAACGTAAQAAYSIGTRLHMVLLMPAFALGNAAATMVGQNLGAGKPERAARATWMAAGLKMVIMAVAAFFLVRYAPEIMAVFVRDGNPEVIRIGVGFMRIISPFLVFGAVAIVFGRALQGAGDAVAPMMITIVTLWMLQVPLAYYFAHHWTPPTTGIWWSMAIASLAHGALVMAWFMTGRWKTKTV